MKTSNYANRAPFVQLYEATPDQRGFFEAVLGFDQLAGQWFRLSAAIQRRYFGNVPFGKRAIKVDEDGKITVFKSQAFGKDWDFWEVAFDHSTKVWRNWSERFDGPALRWLPANF